MHCILACPEGAEQMLPAPLRDASRSSLLALADEVADGIRSYRPRTFPPCAHCGMNTHPAEVCFRVNQPRLEQYLKRWADKSKKSGRQLEEAVEQRRVRLLARVATPELPALGERSRASQPGPQTINSKP